MNNTQFSKGNSYQGSIIGRKIDYDSVNLSSNRLTVQNFPQLVEKKKQRRKSLSNLVEYFDQNQRSLKSQLMNYNSNTIEIQKGDLDLPMRKNEKQDPDDERQEEIIKNGYHFSSPSRSNLFSLQRPSELQKSKNSTTLNKTQQSSQQKNLDSFLEIQRQYDEQQNSLIKNQSNLKKSQSREELNQRFENTNQVNGGLSHQKEDLSQQLSSKKEKSNSHYQKKSPHLNNQNSPQMNINNSQNSNNDPSPAQQKIKEKQKLKLQINPANFQKQHWNSEHSNNQNSTTNPAAGMKIDQNLQLFSSQYNIFLQNQDCIIEQQQNSEYDDDADRQINSAQTTLQEPSKHRDTSGDRDNHGISSDMKRHLPQSQSPNARKNMLSPKSVNQRYVTQGGEGKKKQKNPKQRKQKSLISIVENEKNFQNEMIKVEDNTTIKSPQTQDKLNSKQITLNIKKENVVNLVTQQANNGIHVNEDRQNQLPNQIQLKQNQSPSPIQSRRNPLNGTISREKEREQMGLGFLNTFDKEHLKKLMNFQKQQIEEKLKEEQIKQYHDYIEMKRQYSSVQEQSPEKIRLFMIEKQKKQEQLKSKYREQQELLQERRQQNLQILKDHTQQNFRFQHQPEKTSHKISRDYNQNSQFKTASNFSNFNKGKSDNYNSQKTQNQIKMGAYRNLKRNSSSPDFENFGQTEKYKFYQGNHQPNAPHMSPSEEYGQFNNSSTGNINTHSSENRIEMPAQKLNFAESKQGKRRSKDLKSLDLENEPLDQFDLLNFEFRQMFFDGAQSPSKVFDKIRPSINKSASSQTLQNPDSPNTLSHERLDSSKLLKIEGIAKTMDNFNPLQNNFVKPQKTDNIFLEEKKVYSNVSEPNLDNMELQDQSRQKNLEEEYQSESEQYMEFVKIEDRKNALKSKYEALTNRLIKQIEKLNEDQSVSAAAVGAGGTAATISQNQQIPTLGRQDEGLEQQNIAGNFFQSPDNNSQLNSMESPNFQFNFINKSENPGLVSKNENVKNPNNNLQGSFNMNGGLQLSTVENQKRISDPKEDNLNKTSTLNNSRNAIEEKPQKLSNISGKSIQNQSSESEILDLPQESFIQKHHPTNSTPVANEQREILKTEHSQHSQNSNLDQNSRGSDEEYQQLSQGQVNQLKEMFGENFDLDSIQEHLELLDMAAIVIQKVWRGYQTRKMIQQYFHYLVENYGQMMMETAGNDIGMNGAKSNQQNCLQVIQDQLQIQEQDQQQDEDQQPYHQNEQDQENDQYAEHEEIKQENKIPEKFGLLANQNNVGGRYNDQKFGEKSDQDSSQSQKHNIQSNDDSQKASSRIGRKQLSFRDQPNDNSNNFSESRITNNLSNLSKNNQRDEDVKPVKKIEFPDNSEGQMSHSTLKEKSLSNASDLSELEQRQSGLDDQGWKVGIEIGNGFSQEENIFVKKISISQGKIFASTHQEGDEIQRGQGSKLTISLVYQNSLNNNVALEDYLDILTSEGEKQDSITVGTRDGRQVIFSFAPLGPSRAACSFQAQEIKVIGLGVHRNFYSYVINSTEQKTVAMHHLENLTNMNIANHQEKYSIKGNEDYVIDQSSQQNTLQIQEINNSQRSLVTIKDFSDFHHPDGNSSAYKHFKAQDSEDDSKSSQIDNEASVGVKSQQEKEFKHPIENNKAINKKIQKASQYQNELSQMKEQQIQKWNEIINEINNLKENDSELSKKALQFITNLEKQSELNQRVLLENLELKQSLENNQSPGNISGSDDNLYFTKNRQDKYEKSLGKQELKLENSERVADQTKLSPNNSTPVSQPSESPVESQRQNNIKHLIEEHVPNWNSSSNSLQSSKLPGSQKGLFIDTEQIQESHNNGIANKNSASYNNLASVSDRSSSLKDKENITQNSGGNGDKFSLMLNQEIFKNFYGMRKNEIRQNSPIRIQNFSDQYSTSKKNYYSESPLDSKEKESKEQYSLDRIQNDRESPNLHMSKSLDIQSIQATSLEMGMNSPKIQIAQQSGQEFNRQGLNFQQQRSVNEWEYLNTQSEHSSSIEQPGSASQQAVKRILDQNLLQLKQDRMNEILRLREEALEKRHASQINMMKKMFENKRVSPQTYQMKKLKLEKWLSHEKEQLHQTIPDIERGFQLFDDTIKSTKRDLYYVEKLQNIDGRLQTQGSDELNNLTNENSFLFQQFFNIRTESDQSEVEVLSDRLNNNTNAFNHFNLSGSLNHNNNNTHHYLNQISLAESKSLQSSNPSNDRFYNYQESQISQFNVGKNSATSQMDIRDKLSWDGGINNYTDENENDNEDRQNSLNAQMQKYQQLEDVLPIFFNNPSLNLSNQTQSYINNLDNNYSYRNKAQGSGEQNGGAGKEERKRHTNNSKISLKKKDNNKVILSIDYDTFYKDRQQQQKILTEDQKLLTLSMNSSPSNKSKSQINDGIYEKEINYITDQLINMLTDQLGKELEELGYTTITANSVINSESDAAQASRQCETQLSEVEYLATQERQQMDCLTLNNIKELLVYLSEFIRDNYLNEFIESINTPLGLKEEDYLKTFKIQERIDSEDSERSRTDNPIYSIVKYLNTQKPAVSEQIFTEFYDQYRIFKHDQYQNMASDNAILQYYQFKMILDSFNEALDGMRPHGYRGRPLLWKVYPDKFHQILTTPLNVDKVFGIAIAKTLKWGSFLCGFIPERVQGCEGEQVNLEEDYLNQIKEDRLAQMLENEVQENQHKWVEYEYEDTDIRLQIADQVFESVINQLMDFLQLKMPQEVRLKKMNQEIEKMRMELLLDEGEQMQSEITKQLKQKRTLSQQRQQQNKEHDLLYLMDQENMDDMMKKSIEEEEQEDQDEDDDQVCAICQLRVSQYITTCCQKSICRLCGISVQECPLCRVGQENNSESQDQGDEETDDNGEVEVADVENVP